MHVQKDEEEITAAACLQWRLPHPMPTISLTQPVKHIQLRALQNLNIRAHASLTQTPC